PCLPKHLFMSNALGHADASFTLKVYTHLYDDQRAAGALSLDDLLETGSEENSPIPRPTSTADLSQGLEALKQLHQALGTFLETAPEWAATVLEEMTQARTPNADSDRLRKL
ncbi:hypothetical protein QOL99_06890, partial [Deinococcus sp. MIMF12]